MKTSILAMGAVLIAGLAGGAYIAGAGGGEVDAAGMSRDFVKALERDPNRGRPQMLSGIDLCLPDQARPFWKQTAIKDLSVEVYRKSIDLMGQGLTKQESSEQLKNWVIKEGEKLSAQQRTDFIKLMQSGLYDGATMLCVISSVNGAMRTL